MAILTLSNQGYDHKPDTLKPSRYNKKEANTIGPSFSMSTEGFKAQRLTETHAMAMCVVFIANAFCILHFINMTVIHLLTVSRIFVSFGFIGFLAAYLLRNKLKLSLLDGLFYNLFGIAPILLSLFLLVNAQCTDTNIETYNIVGAERGGSGFTYELESKAYQDYWRIRNLDLSEANNRYHRLQFTTCKGLFGYKLIKKREMKP